MDYQRSEIISGYKRITSAAKESATEIKKVMNVKGKFWLLPKKEILSLKK